MLPKLSKEQFEEWYRFYLETFNRNWQDAEINAFKHLLNAQYNRIAEYLEGLTPEGLREEVGEAIYCISAAGRYGKDFPKWQAIKLDQREYFKQLANKRILSLVNAYYQSRQPVDRVKEVCEILHERYEQYYQVQGYPLPQNSVDFEEGIAQQICQLSQEGEKG